MKRKIDYKLASIILAIISIFSIVFSTIYTDFYSRRNNEINYLDKQKSDLINELKEIRNIPKLKVAVNSLDGENISDNILSFIKNFPSSIEIKNTSDVLAENLIVKVTSSEQILEKEFWESINDYSITFNKTKNEILLKIPKIKASSSLGLTIITPKITSLNYQIYSDNKFIEDKGFDYSLISSMILDESKFSLIKDFTNFKLNQQIQDELYKDCITTEEVILKIKIKQITQDIEKWQNKTFYVWLRDKFSITDNLLMLVIVFSVIYLLLIYVMNIIFNIYYKRKYEKALIILNSEKSNIFTMKDIVKLFNKPTDIQLLTDEQNVVIQLRYYSSRMFVFKGFSGLKFKLYENGKIEIFDSNNNIIEK